VTAELLDVARSIAERATRDEQVEGYLVHDRTFHAKAYAGDIESVTSAEPRGAGARVVTGHRTGFAFTTDLSNRGIELLVGDARSNAAFATPDEAAGLALPGPAAVEVPGLWHDGQSRVTPEQKTAFAIELEKLTRAFDHRIRTVEEAVYADSSSEVAIATSTGIESLYRRTEAWCYSIALATDGDDTEVGFEFALGRGLDQLDAADVARRSCERALGVLGASKIASSRMPVLFDPYVAGQFLGVLARALTAEAVQKGRSMFAGKLGEEVAAGLSLVDDGRIQGAPGSAPWDAEGVATQRTEVIRDGTLTSFLYDTTSARREGGASTGNAARTGFKSVPRPSASNLAFETTGHSKEEVLRRAGRALLVQEFHGVHSGANPVSGDFSVGVTGRLLEDGMPVRSVKEVTIAAPMPEILGRIVAVADDRRWLPFGGSYGGATTLVSEMTVGGL
jgi:PmbA protein